MRLPWKRVRRIGYALVALLAAAVVLAPYQSADGYRDRIRKSLEQALGRPVEIEGPVHFNLLTGPGFTAANIVIHELPQYGLEPIAYVSEMDARVSLLSLATGKLEFSTLRLNEPSVNLVKTDDDGWNLQAFFARRSVANASELPVIVLRGGRIHFKFGDTKSIFYLTNADLDLSASSDGKGVDVWFAGEPSRTDRAAQGFGRFIARGRWLHDPQSLDFNLELERADLDQLSEFLRGRTFGLHGLVTSTMRMAGPASNVELDGQVQIEDIHRWDLMPTKGGGWRVPVKGRLNLPGQTFDLQTAGDGKAPLALEFHARDLLSRVTWTAAMTADNLPAAPLLEVARHMGGAIPPALAVDGTLSGAITYEPEHGFGGELALRDFALKSPRAEPFSVDNARLALAGAEARLTASAGSGASARVMLDSRLLLSTGSLDVSLAGKAIPVVALHSASGRLFGAEPIPVLEGCDQGSWTGRLEYHRAANGPGAWSGALEVQGVRMKVPGVSEPLRIAAAALTLDGERLVVKSMRARAGGVEFQGDYRYEPEAPRPHHFDFSAREVDAATLEDLLRPSLRRPQSFFARTLRLRSAPAELPDWLANRKAEGTVRIGTFYVAGVRLDGYQARLRWEGTRVSSTNVQFTLEEGAGAAYFIVNLKNAIPEYRVGMRVKNFAWNGSRCDVDGVFLSSGTGPELLRNLESQGSFEARGLPSSADNQIRDISGSYELAGGRDLPRLRFTGIEVLLGSETFRGDGASSPDGKLQVQLSNGSRQVKLSGLISPFQLEVVNP